MEKEMSKQDQILDYIIQIKTDIGGGEAEKDC